MTTAAGMPGSSPMGSPAAAAAAAAAGGPEVAARDAVIGWFRGEFAAANAMIDALCGHLAQIGGGGAEYDPVFAALHRRRANWFPVLHMQKFYPVADVTAELRRVADARAAVLANAGAAGSCCYSEEAASTVIQEPMEDLPTEAEAEAEPEPQPEPEHEHQHHHQQEQDPVQQDPAPAASEEADGTVIDPAVEYHEQDAEVDSAGDSSERKAPSTEDDTVADGHHTDQGSQREHSIPESYPICSDHEECIARPERIKIQKGFVAKESVKGHMVNVVKGLKIYEDVFTTSEIMKVAEFINEIRQAGRNGELSGRAKPW